MASRKPPTREQIYQALMDVQLTGGTPTLRQDLTALPYVVARLDVKKSMHTTLDRAQDWLLDALTAEDSPLILVDTACGHVFDGEQWNPSPLFDWITTRQYSMTFSGGHLSTSGRGNHGSCIMRRDQIEPIHRALAKVRRQREGEQREEDAARLAAFRALHGPAYDQIASVVDQVSAPTWSKLDDRLSPRVSERSTFTDLWGGTTELTITLRGKQIDEFAEALRKLNRQAIAQGEANGEDTRA